MASEGFFGMASIGKSVVESRWHAHSVALALDWRIHGKRESEVLQMTKPPALTGSSGTGGF
jgi:hypothetical protein